VLKVGDVVTMRSPNVRGIGGKPYKIDPDGNIWCPEIGTIKASGMTVGQLETEVITRVVATVQAPVVSVRLVHEPVFLFGDAFVNPGIYELEDQRKLLDLVADIGGFKPNASGTLIVMRPLEHGIIPLPNAVVDEKTNVSIVEIDIKSLQANPNSPENLTLMLYDGTYVDRRRLR
jgi:polysaccharide biosynthesis/export protein